MTSIEDFTALSLGAEVALEGRIARCTRCGRNGIEQGRGDGADVYMIHVQVSRVLGDGMLTEPSDFCVVEPGDGRDSVGHPNLPAPAGLLRPFPRA